MSESKTPAARRPGVWRLGTLFGVEVFVANSWIFIAILIAVVMAPRVDQVAPGLGAMKYLAGLVFAVLLYLSVLLHEIAHAVMAKRFGLPVGAITLHFLGGMTEIHSESKTPGQEFMVAVVGPLTSIAFGFGSLGLLLASDVTGLIALVLEALATTNIFVGAFNLLPGIPLDGGRVVKAAVWKLTGKADTGLFAAAWGGRICAVIAFASPWILRMLGVTTGLTDFVLSAMVALFIWGGASSALQIAKVRRSLPTLSARALARPTITVPDGMSIAEAVRRAQSEGVGAILTHTTTGEVSGVVSEGALSTVEEERRPWQAISSVARPIADTPTLMADIPGAELLRVLGTQPAAEYLLVDPDHQIFGVLMASDIEAALAKI